MLKYALVTAAGILTATAVEPRLDLICARVFYAGHGHFIGVTPIGTALRDAARLAPFVLIGACLLLSLAARIGLIAKAYAPSGRSVMFLMLSFALGPGLLVDGILKQAMHRPRPVHIREFGGTEAFTPFFRAAGDCRRNCSFPSGEAAAAFWMVVPASIAPAPVRPALTGLALLFGTAAGGLRMAFGGHFLSDVAAAGGLMLMVAVLFRRISQVFSPPSCRGGPIFPRWRSAFPGKNSRASSARIASSERQNRCSDSTS